MNQTLIIALAVLMGILAIVGAVRLFTPGSTEWGHRASTRRQEYLYNALFGLSMLGLVATIYGLGVPNMTICLTGLLTFLGALGFANNCLALPDWAKPPRQHNESGKPISRLSLLSLASAYVVAVLISLLHPNFQQMVYGSLTASVGTLALCSFLFLMMGFMSTPWQNSIFSDAKWSSFFTDVGILTLTGGLTGAVMGGLFAAVCGAHGGSPIGFIAGAAVGALISLILCTCGSAIYFSLLFLVVNTTKSAYKSLFGKTNERRNNSRDYYHD